MKKIVTPQEMQEIDRRTIQDYKITGEILMECAGAAVFERIRVLFTEYTAKNIFVFCGKGNNGGDGFVIARYLKENGAAPKVFVTGSLEDVKMDARIHFNKLIAGGVQPIFISNMHDLGNEKPDIIVDALLGTGARGSLDGELLNLVEKINAWRNQQGCYVLSVDIPSGMNGETGRVENAAVKADATVTMGLPKSGLLFGDGKHYTGKLYVADIGFPDELTRGDKFVLIEKEDVRHLLKPRSHNAYKYDFGKVLIIAGSRGMILSGEISAENWGRFG